MITIVLSDGTKGSIACCKKVGAVQTVGMPGLKESLVQLLPDYECIVRPQKYPKATGPKTKPTTTMTGIVSGKYPYKNFIQQHFLPLLNAQLHNGKVLLVCYSFSCRAVSLLFQSLLTEDAAADQLNLIQTNLIGIVLLSPPFGDNKKDHTVPVVLQQNEKVADQDFFDQNWAASYTFVPQWLPLHFIVGAKAATKFKDWTESLVAGLNAANVVVPAMADGMRKWWDGNGQRKKSERTFRVIEDCKETFVDHVDSVARAIADFLTFIGGDEGNEGEREGVEEEEEEEEEGGERDESPSPKKKVKR